MAEETNDTADSDFTPPTGAIVCLTQEQVDLIIKAGLDANPEQSSLDLWNIAKWADQAVLNHELLQKVFRGELNLEWDEATKDVRLISTTK
jgi:hypothetical protein